MRLWVDDERPPPDDTWTWVKTADEALDAFLNRGLNIVEISFDHDLGEGGTTRELASCVLGLAHAGQRQPPRWYVHSANPVGKEWLESTLNRADHYWRQHKTQEHLAASYKRRTP